MEDDREDSKLPPNCYMTRKMMMMTEPARRSTSTTGTSPSAPSAAAAGRTTNSSKKPRKPYTISNRRERWTGEEHERFVHALLLFGRDWKTVQQLVGTKTATQIRSHAQKFFLKASKLGLAHALPPPHPSRRSAALFLPKPPAVGAGRSGCFLDDDDATASLKFAGAAQQQRTVDWEEAVLGGSPSDQQACWFVAEDCLPQDDDAAAKLPLSPDDARFAEVYRFVGDVFGSGLSFEAQLRRLSGVDDPAVAETILMVLGNLQDNLCG